MRSDVAASAGSPKTMLPSCATAHSKAASPAPSGARKYMLVVAMMPADVVWGWLSAYDWHSDAVALRIAGAPAAAATAAHVE